MNDVEILYNSVSDVELYNKIFNDLQKLFVEYMKAKFPVVSALSALKQDRLMKIEEERLNKLLDNIQNKMEFINKNKIDYNFVRSEEFVRIVFDVFDKAKTDHREEKLKYYANILLNYSNVNYSKDFYKEGIIERISKYSIEHILILNEAYNFYKINKQREDLPRGIFKKSNILIENIDSSKIELCILDLRADGLLNEVTGLMYGVSIPQDFVITDYGIKCIKTITDSKDKKFIKTK